MLIRIWNLALLKVSAGALLLLPAYSFRNTMPGPIPEPEIVAASYPKNYFQNPVNDAIRLSGTFGELRSNHFHSGLDIKSKTGGSGQPVLVAADGYIAQVKVQAGGYGNVLYVRHPNGYTTVYAHLDRFSPKVEQYVQAQQYKKERFEVVLNLPASQFPVRQGEEIGKLGNSGSSSGPHLHFEIRHTATQKVLNPQLFGLPVQDRMPPEPRDMKAYFLNARNEVVSEIALPIYRRTDGRYSAVGDTVELTGQRVGFAIKAFDKMDNLRNDNGIYALSLTVEGKKVYDWRMDELDFGETRYLNAHIDYSARERYGAWFHRCFVLPGNRLSNYSLTETQGAVMLSPHRALRLNVKAVDASGNSAEVEFWARAAAEMPAATGTPAQIELPIDAESNINQEGFSMQLPKGSLYENITFSYKATPAERTDVYSALHQVHRGTTPVHRYYTLSLAADRLPETLRGKAVIARLDRTGKPVSHGGSWKDGMVTARVRSFGDFCVMADTEAPKIVPVVFDHDMRRKNTLSFRITDNFATEGNAKGLSYYGTIDGKWVLFEYDRKSNRLTHRLDARNGSGEHRLKLVVKDDRGNSAVFERSFLR